MPVFGIPRARLLVYAGCLAVGLSLLLWPSHSGDADTYARAWHEQTVAHRKQLARARQTAVTTRLVYVTKSSAALKAVEALPPAQLLRDTLTLPDGTFAIPHPVALYIADLQATVAMIPPVVASADTALVATDTVDAAAKVVDTDQTVEIKAQRPSLLHRAFDRVKVPGAFLLGAWIGAKVTR